MNPNEYLDNMAIAQKEKLAAIYNLHLSPKINDIAWSVHAAIKTKRITVLAEIDEHEFDHTKGMKYGAFSVAEAWSDLAEILSKYFNYREVGLDTVELIDIIDLLVDDLKAKKLVYMEW